METVLSQKFTEYENVNVLQVPGSITKANIAKMRWIWVFTKPHLDSSVKKYFSEGKTL